MKKVTIVEENVFESGVKDKVSLLDDAGPRSCATYHDNQCFSPSSEDSFRSKSPSFISSRYLLHL